MTVDTIHGHEDPPTATARPIRLDFDQSLGAYMGTVEMFKYNEPGHLHEYFLAPEYVKKEDGSYSVVGYGLIHRSRLPTQEQMIAREEQIG